MNLNKVICWITFGFACGGKCRDGKWTCVRCGKEIPYREKFNPLHWNKSDPFEPKYPLDCRKIVEVAGSAPHFIGLTFKDAERIWRLYSYTYSANWLMIEGGYRSDEDIIKAVKRFKDTMEY